VCVPARARAHPAGWAGSEGCAAASAHALERCRGAARGCTQPSHNHHVWAPVMGNKSTAGVEAPKEGLRWDRGSPQALLKGREDAKQAGDPSPHPPRLTGKPTFDKGGASNRMVRATR